VKAKHFLIPVAAAVVAASASAQVTLGGTLGFSYEKDRTTPKAVHGMAMTDGHLNFSAKEDLGGGYSATATSEFASRGRDNTFAPRDATLNLMTPVGLLTLGSVEADNALIGRGFGGAPISLPTGLDGGVIGGGDKIDVAAFNTKLGGVIVGLAYSEAGSQDISDLANKLGAQTFPAGPLTGASILSGGINGNLSSGAPGAGGGPLKAVSLSAAYENGPLSVGVGITQDTVDLGTITDKAAALLLKAGYDGRIGTSLSLSYDFGFAKLGAGLSTKNKGWATETTFGFSVPMGSATIGLAYAAKTDDSETLGDGVTASQAADAVSGRLGLALGTLRTADLKGSAAKSGYAVGVDYALSKLTTVNASYGVYTVKDADRLVNPTTGGRVLGSVTDEFRIRLMKTF
jgi:predicted porin